MEEVPPAQIAGLYRALRKGRKDNKDEPGAADFYYGEMEMRRHARHEQARQERRRGHWGTWATARVEHAILWLYWLVSGYALRSWRALAAFAALLVRRGDVAQILLRFLGPVLLGLAILSIRGRVKR